MVTMTPDEAVVWTNRPLSVIEGCFYAVMVALGESLLIPAALSLGLKPSYIAILATFPVALGGLSQFLSPALQAKCGGHTKSLIFSFMVIQVSGLFFLGFKESLQFKDFLLGATLYWIGGAACQPLWIGWMIPENPSTGLSLYHARRNALIAFVTFSSFVICGSFLKGSGQIERFQYLFFGAGVARLVGATLITFHKEQRKSVGRVYEEQLSLWKKIPRQKWRSNFTLQLIFILVLFRTGAGFSTPHFAQYMLQNLHLNYLNYTLLVGSAFLGRTILLERWMLTSQQFGSKNALLACCFIISFLPALWLVNDSLLWLFPLEVVGGGAWACFELLVILIVAGLGIERWNRYVGLLGMWVTFGALAGGWVAGRFMEHGFSIQFVFVVSTCIRLGAAVLLFLTFRRFVREEVKLKKFFPIFFSSLSLRPSFSNINWIFWRKRA